MSTYQNMTALPEALERALLDLPLPVLLRACKWAGASTKYTCIIYLVNHERWPETELRKLAATEYTDEDVAQMRALQYDRLKKPGPSDLPPITLFGKECDPRHSEFVGKEAARAGVAEEPKPVKKAAKIKLITEPGIRGPLDVAPERRKAERRGGITDNTVVLIAEGKTKLAQGGARRRLMEHLKEMGGRATIGELTEKVGQPAKPLIGKLLEVGWVTLKEEK